MSSIEGQPPKRSITISEQHGLWRVDDSLGNGVLSATLPGALLKFAVLTHHDEIVASDLTTTANTISSMLPERRGA